MCRSVCASETSCPSSSNQWPWSSNLWFSQRKRWGFAGSEYGVGYLACGVQLRNARFCKFWGPASGVGLTSGKTHVQAAGVDLRSLGLTWGGRQVGGHRWSKDPGISTHRAAGSCCVLHTTEDHPFGQHTGGLRGAEGPGWSKGPRTSPGTHAATRSADLEFLHELSSTDLPFSRLQTDVPRVQVGRKTRAYPPAF